MKTAKQIVDEKNKLLVQVKAMKNERENNTGKWEDQDYENHTRVLIARIAQLMWVLDEQTTKETFLLT